MKKVTKAIIPAAGLGTRFLPATKTVPKEMLTIVDSPIILYVVEEAIKAGIHDIVLIAGRGKHAIEDFFDTSYELEDKLAKDGKLHLLDRVIKIKDQANVISVRQKQALGLGHAVLCGQAIIGDDPFAVLLGDEITMGSADGSIPNATQSLTRHFDETQCSCISVMNVSDQDVSKYGVAEVENESADAFMKIKNLIEKPKATETKSRWALPGRYVFTSDIFTILKSAQPGLNNEIQLTDSMRASLKHAPMHALPLKARRFDAGDKLGYLQANIELGLEHADLKTELKNYLVQLATQLKA